MSFKLEIGWLITSISIENMDVLIVDSSKILSTITEFDLFA